jgi:hypothetical protein
VVGHVRWGTCSLSDCGGFVGLSGGAGAPPAPGGHPFGVGRRGVGFGKTGGIKLSKQGLVVRGE